MGGAAGRGKAQDRPVAAAASKTLGMPSKCGSLASFVFASPPKSHKRWVLQAARDVYDSAGSPLVAKIPSVKVYCIVHSGMRGTAGALIAAAASINGGGVAAIYAAHAHRGN